jgi:glycosyltransferase involved in cell wall biosynthesis
VARAGQKAILVRVARAGATVAVYNDQAYWHEGGSVYTARAFIVFLNELARAVDRLVVVGRLDPAPKRSHYRLSDELDFAPLPWYADASSPLAAARALIGSARSLWRVLDDVDCVWVLGPYPLSLVLIALAAVRRRRIVLGVRQDMPLYMRNRHPRRRWIQLAASSLERAYRLLARRYPVVVVGPQLARNYGSAPRKLEISVSLVHERDIADAGDARSYDGPLEVISVGRLDPEKNPLMLADVLARLHERDGRWRLTVCGDGPLEAELERRLESLGVRALADMRGHVPIDDGLMDLYRRSHAFLHVSWTEGLPQVLLEAAAAGLPIVATAVGGVEEAISDSALLVPPGDVAAAVGALQRLADDPQLRERLVAAGREHVRAHTIEAECERVAEFITNRPEFA